MSNSFKSLLSDQVIALEWGTVLQCVLCLFFWKCITLNGKNLYLNLYLTFYIFCWRVLWQLQNWCSFADHTYDNSEIFQKKKTYLKIGWLEFSIISLDSIAETLASFCGCAGQFVSGLVGNLTGSAVITHDVTTGTGYCLVGFNWIIDFLN